MPARGRNRGTVMNRLLPLCLTVAQLGAAANALGQTAPPDNNLMLAGFATLGVARSNSDQFRYAGSEQGHGVGRQADFGLDSVLGMQLSYRINPALSATAQALVRRDVDGHYRPDLSWALVRARLSDDVTLRAGRFGLPGLLMTDIQDVSYAYTLMRPSVELYSQVVIDHIDGANLAYQYMVGDNVLTTELSAGRNRSRTLTTNGDGTIVGFQARLLLLTVTLEHGPFTLRLSHDRFYITVADRPALIALHAGLNSTGFGPLAQQLTLHQGKRFHYDTASLQMDQGHWQLGGEYGWRRGDEPSYVPNTNAWYLMAGWRWGALLPYYSHARLRQTGNTVNAPLPASGPLATAVRTAILQGPEQQSDTLGLRWNWRPGRSLTVQVDRVRPSAKNGLLLGPSGGGLARPVTVLGLALDVVF